MIFDLFCHPSLPYQLNYIGKSIPTFILDVIAFVPLNFQLSTKQSKMTFSLTTQQRRNVSIAALSAVAVVGIASLIFKTYPHLKPSFLGGDASSKDPDEDQVLKSTVIVNKKDIADWSDDDLRAFLKSVSVEFFPHILIYH